MHGVRAGGSEHNINACCGSFVSFFVDVHISFLYQLLDPKRFIGLSHSRKVCIC